jgi:diaminohydroxyphosphoribosylaminopyrimidine deaminase/5-amino-6-(5-phosphoribosylamino)uracil reductase
MSLDGRTAMASGESQWITGPAARADVQRLRAMSCVVVTGIGTVLSDDCSLTVRASELGLPLAEAELASLNQPLRVVLDSNLQTPASAAILDGAAPTLICHDEKLDASTAIFASGVDRLALGGDENGLNLAQLIDYLSARQSNEILVECGPRLAGAFVREGLLDELIVYMAPVLMGSAARPLLDLPLEAMAQKIPLQIEDMRKVGDDWRVTAIPQY